MAVMAGCVFMAAFVFFEFAASSSSHRAPAVVGKPAHQRHLARPIMEGTWVSSAKSGRIRAARLAFIACIVGGLLQKPLIKFAWDVQAFQTQLARVYQHISTRGGGAALLGGTAILLRQIFATKGQELVGDIAVTLAMAGTMWYKRALVRLHKKLVKMDPRDTKKRKGLMAVWSGPKWVSGLFQAKQMRRFKNASALLGDFLTSEVTEANTFHDICFALSSPQGKLDNLGKYSIPHLVRACFVARAFIHGDGGEVGVFDDDAWELHLRDMHKRSTTQTFGTLGVSKHIDALMLQCTIVEVARKVWCPAIACHFSSMSILDLPCQACEFKGIIGAVNAIHGGGDAKAISWLLAHLPGELSELKAMGVKLRHMIAKVDGKGDGLDRQAAGAVTRLWLQQDPGPPKVSMQSILTNGSWDMFGVPVVACPKCSQPMLGNRKGRKPMECKVCYRKRICQADMERKRKERRHDK